MRARLKALNAFKNLNSNISMTIFKFSQIHTDTFHFDQLFFWFTSLISSWSFSFFSFDTTIFKFRRNFIKSIFIFNNNPSNKTNASFLNSDNGSFWPYCLKPITCLSCSKYCRCDLHEKSMICKIFFQDCYFDLS